MVYLTRGERGGEPTAAYKEDHTDHASRVRTQISGVKARTLGSPIWRKRMNAEEEAAKAAAKVSAATSQGGSVGHGSDSLESSRTEGVSHRTEEVVLVVPRCSASTALSWRSKASMMEEALRPSVATTTTAPATTPPKKGQRNRSTCSSVMVRLTSCLAAHFAFLFEPFTDADSLSTAV